MKLKTPIDVRREVAAVQRAINDGLDGLNAKLDSLNKAHGPDAPQAYAEHVLKEKQRELRAAAADKHVEAYNAAISSVIDLNHNADYFSRQAVMERAELPVPVRPAGKLTEEMQPVIDAMKRVEAQLEFSRLVDAVRAANDEALVERWAPKAVRENHHRLAAVISDEASSRSGLMAIKVSNILETMSIPEAEKYTEDLELLEGEVRNLKSAFNTISTGEKDTRAQMQAAVAKLHQHS